MPEPTPEPLPGSTPEASGAALAELRAALGGCPLGRVAEWHACLPSTMDRAAALAATDVPSGTVVVADRQTAGRGRLGRVWEAEAGESLMFSLLLRPRGPLARTDALPQIPLALALGALDALRRRLPRPEAASLKWPNDLLLDGAKAGGQLAELRGDPAAPTLVLGLGLNLRQRAFLHLPQATSLARHLGCPPEDPRLRPAPLLADLLRATAERLARLEAGGSLLQEWGAQLSTLGRRIRVHPLGEAAVAGSAPACLEGLAEGLGPQGELLLRDDAGRLHRLQAGDVSLAAG